VLVAIGAVPAAAERYLPRFLRRDFGLRLLAIATFVLAVSPAFAMWYFQRALYGIAFVSFWTILLGFLGYCEMYRALDRLHGAVSRMRDEDFDVDFDSERVDEVGELYAAVEGTAADLDETLTEARAARERAERQEQRAQEQAERVEAQREQAEGLAEALEAAAATCEETMRAVAAGDLRERIDLGDDTESMAAIETAFNDLVVEWEETLTTTKRFAADVGAETDAVSAAVGEAHDAGERAADAAGEIEAATERQADRLGSVVDELGTLSASVDEVVDGVAAVAEESAAAADACDEGRAVADGLADDVAATREATVETAEELDALADEIAEIGSVVTVIDDIAEQTNMLALNANVEASRAGADGAGFEVVADNVKELADETREQVQEIAALVESVQRRSGAVVDRMDETRERVDDAADGVDTVAAAFETVGERVERTDSRVREIRAATDDQAESTAAAVELVEDVAADGDATADRATAVGDAVRAQLDALSDARERVDALADGAATLESSLAYFETDAEGTTTPAVADD